MPDDLDNASILEETFRKTAIQNQLSKSPSLTFTGRCHWCGEPLTHGNFCAGDSCADDYERRKRADTQRA